MKLRNKQTHKIIEAEFWMVRLVDGKYKVVKRFKSNEDAKALDEWEQI